MKKMVGFKSSRLMGIGLLVAILGIASGCSKSGDPMNGDGGNNGGGNNPGTNEVWIKGMAFQPSAITISAGTTITWTNKEATTHTVTSDNALFDSGSINGNNTYSRPFPSAGTFAYHCALHPTMTATVIVN